MALTGVIVMVLSEINPFGGTSSVNTVPLAVVAESVPPIAAVMSPETARPGSRDTVIP